MSTYIDPSTAMTIARQARAEQISRAEQYHQTRTAQGHEGPADGPPTSPSVAPRQMRALRSRVPPLGFEPRLKGF